VARFDITSTYGIGKMAAPDVTVIMPVYNSDRYLNEAINSVFKQTLKNIELICIDDGSTDGSSEIMESFNDPRMSIIKQINSGPGPARNRGIDAAKGEFIAFLDADDYYPDQNSLSDMVKFARANNVSICGGRRMEFFKNKAHMVDLYEKEIAEHDQGTILQYADVQSDYHFVNHIFKRELILNNGIEFPPYRRFQDPPFFVRSMLCAGEFGIVPAVSYCYRIHKKVGWTEEYLTDLIKGLTDDLILAKDNRLSKLYGRTLYRLVAEYGKIIYRNRTDKIEGMLNELDGMVSSEPISFAIGIKGLDKAPLFEILRSRYGLRRFIGLKEYGKNE